jgi:branched-chain amino acid transport system substrate-binding protein
MSADAPRRRTPVTRRQLVGGMGAATFGGVLLGGAGGFLGGKNADSEASTTAKGKPITIGVLAPVTGAGAGDGQEMVRGIKLGVAEVNAGGGVGGRPLRYELLDAKDQTPEVMTSAMRKFVADRVAAVFSPFLSYTNVETPIVGRAKIPLFHVNTFQGNVDFAIKNGYRNIFQGCPSEIWYAKGFLTVVQGLIDAGKWTPRDKTVAIVSSNDAYSISIARTFRSDIKKLGWNVVQFDTYTVPQSEWGSTLTRIRAKNPDIVFQSDYFAGDEASFIKQFAQSPTKSLVYQQYAPSVPEYLKLAGKSANGVLWATTTGTIRDELGNRFADAYKKAFHSEPGFANAGNQRDLVVLWAQAASAAPDPFAYDDVGDNVRRMVFRGVNGAYKLGPDQQTNLPYPAKEKDPSLGEPLLTFQIQDGKQVLISPDPYTTGAFQLPPWLT